LRRAYWSADFAEAHVVEAMLRAHGVQAWVFDALLVRQDWFKTLMFGGYRVMVPDEDAARAADLIGEYRAGALAVADDAVERPACPRCATPGREDPEPRRIVFVVIIALQVLVRAGLMYATHADDATAIVLGASIVAAPIAVIMATRYLKGRYACPQCATRWRARPQPFATMASDVETAADIDGSAKGEPAP
jgi:hypothetical protein